jgi:tape measure domain-containing protein
MDLSIIWKLKDLMSAPINRVVAAAQNAGRLANAAGASMSRGFLRAATSVNDLRSRLDSLRAYRDGLQIGIDSSKISAANMQLRELQRQMDSIDRRNSRADGSGSGGMLMGLGRKFLPFLAASTLAHGAMGVGKMGVDRESTLARFEQFTGSAENAKNIVGQLNKYADATPYENDTLLDIGAKLSMNFGKDRIMPLTKMLGDVAAADAGRLQSIQLALSQVKSLGRMQGQDMMQFTNAQVPMMEYLAKAKNVKISAVKGLMEDGKISYDDVENALSIMTSKGGVFFGFMDRMSNTTFGKMSTLIGTVKNKFAELSMNELPGLNSVIDWAVKFVDNFKPAGDAIMNFGKAFKPLFGAVGQILQSFSLVPKTGDGVIDTVNGIAGVFNTMASVVSFASNAINGLVTGIRALPFGDKIVEGLVLVGVFQKLAIARSVMDMGNVLTSLGSFGGIGSLLKDLASINYLKIFTGLNGLKVVWAELGVAFTLNPIGAVIVAIVALIGAVTYAWQNSEKFREVMIRTGYGIMAVWDALCIWVMNLVDNIKIAFNAIVKFHVDLYNAITGIWQKVKDWVHGIFESLPQPVQDFINKVIEGFSWMGDKIASIWKAIKDDTIAVIKGIFDATPIGMSLNLYKYGAEKFATPFKEGYNSNEAYRAVDDDRQERRKPLLDSVKKTLELIDKIKDASSMKNLTSFGKSGTPAGLGNMATNADKNKVSETVEGGKSRTIKITVKNLVETINNYVDTNGTGKKVTDDVLEALNRIMNGADRLALE